MSSAIAWITAIATTALAVMAVITSNGTYQIPFPWIKARSCDPAPEDSVKLADLKVVVQSQAETIKVLETQVTDILDLLSDMAEVLEQRMN